MVISGNDLSIGDVYAIAVENEPVDLDAGQLAAVRSVHRRVQEWGRERYPIYGVNTGFGELIHYMIPPGSAQALQLNLIRSHAAGAGEAFSDEISRAIMAVRLNCLMKGYSGVSEQAVTLLREFLNRRITPLIPQQGSLGASGDLAPLSHLALTLVGEGHVRCDGRVRPAAEVLQEHDLRPLTPGFKEALGLINGTSGMTGAACLALVRAATLLKLAVLASAYVVQCLRGSTRAFDERGHALKNHPGQIAIAAALRQALAGSGLTREHEDIMRAIAGKMSDHGVVDAGVYLQSAYSLRCIPQILGPVLETHAFCRRLVEEEVNACNDNPLIMDTPEETFHGGNFHGQYVAMACDYLAIAIVEIGALAERQLNRLVDPHLNGELPAFLAAGETGLHCGYEGGQYLAASLASENLDLAAPSSVKSIPSNGSNQDIVSMGLTAARRALRVCDHTLTILATLVGACHQASRFLGGDQFSRSTRLLQDALAADVPLYTDGFAIADVIAQVGSVLASKAGAAYLNRVVDLGASVEARAWDAAPAAAVGATSYPSFATASPH